MNKSENTLLIWVLSIAGLLLAVLYSPLGSPDIYQSRVYFSNNQGVSFDNSTISKGTKAVSSLQSHVGSMKSGLSSLKSGLSSLKSITNSNKSRSSNAYSGNPEINVPDATGKKSKNYRGSSSSGSTSTITASGVRISSKAANPGIKSIANSGTQSQNFSGNSGSSTSGEGQSTYTSTRNNGGSVSQAPTTVSSIATLNDSTSLLASNYSAEKTQGILDPGMTDPTGDPVPLPDGWGYMLVLAASYGVYILLRLKKQKNIA